MPLGAYAANRVGGIPALTLEQRIQDDRRGQRGKNGFALPPETRKLQCIAWHDGETPANCDLRNARVLALVLVPHNPFDNPAVLGDLDQSFAWGVLRQCRDPVFSGLLLAFRPFDQQPLLCMRLRLPIVTMSRTDSNGGKARS